MRKILLLIIISLLGSEVAMSQNYNSLMGKAIKKAIGSDLRGYKTFSYPTDNFGLITSYNSSVDAKNFICDMWNCVGLKPLENATSDWLSMSGYAAVGTGGAIDLSESKQQKLAVNILLPKIYEVIGVTATAASDRTIKTTVTIGKAYLRMLRKQPMLDYISKLPSTSLMKQAFNGGELVLIVSDCVIEDLSVSIEVDAASSAKLDAKLGTGSTALQSKVFTDASLSVSAEKVSSGKYTFKVMHPVIFARLIKKQPKAGYLGNEDSFEGWKLLNPKSDGIPVNK